MLDELNATMGETNYGSFDTGENTGRLFVDMSCTRGSYTFHIIGKAGIKTNLLVPFMDGFDAGKYLIVNYGEL